MLAALSVGLGRDEATFGRYLGPVGAARASPAELRGLGARERRRTILLDLLERPADGDSLGGPGDIDFALGDEGTGRLRDPGRGQSRLCALAGQVRRRGARGRGRGQAEVFLRLAVQKDPGLLDALFLRAKVAARDGRAEGAVDGLRAMLARGVKAEVLRRWVEGDEDLGAWLRTGRLDALKL